MNIALNADKTSIKNCSYIYAPKGQAFEYSALATNPYRGCGHKCAYCYVPNILRMNRKDFDSSAITRPNYINNLKKDAAKYKHLSITQQVMLSFTTDPYHPFNNSLTREALLILQDNGLGICTLTKGGSRALRDIDLFRPSRDAFATTLTSINNEFSKKWESGSALASDRVETLKKFHDAGIFTWVSLEPTLDINESINILENTHSFINLFKIGRVNYLPMTKTTDWNDYTLKIIDICHKLNIKHYIKKDLQKYLPDGYYNPLRINQFH